MGIRLKRPSLETIIHIALGEIIVNAIWAGVTKVLTIQSPIRDWGFLALSIVVLIVVGWYLGKRFGGVSKDVAKKVPSPEETWLQEVLKSNQTKIYQAIKGRITLWDFSGIGALEPYFEIYFEITNTSIFTIHLTGVSGHIKIGVNQLLAPPQVNLIRGIQQGDSVSIIMRQPISSQTSTIISAAGKSDSQINFDLSEIALDFETTTKGYEGTPCHLKGKAFTFIPKERTYGLPFLEEKRLDKSALTITIPCIKIGEKISDNSFLLLVIVRFEPSAPIQLSKLDLVYKPSALSRYITSSPLSGLPTKLIERVATYEVEYEIAGFIGDFLLKIGFLEQNNTPESEWPQARLHVLAGNLDFNTDEVPMPTPTWMLASGKEGSQN